MRDEAALDQFVAQLEFGEAHLNQRLAAVRNVVFLDVLEYVLGLQQILLD